MLADPREPAGAPGGVLRESLDFDEEASVQALRQGRVAMLRAWPVARGTLTAPSPENPTTGTNISVCQLPGRGSILGGQNLAVSGRSAHPVEAEALVRSRREGRDVIVGAVVLLGLDALRVTTALAVAAGRPSSASEEVLDALC